MKQKIAILLCMLLMFTGGIGGATVKAAGDYTNPSLKVTEVEDINVYNNYLVNFLAIDNTLINNQNGEQVYKFTIEHDGFVKLLLSARNLTKTVINNGKFTKSDATLSATVYRDPMLLYPVVPAVTAKGQVKGESAQKIALDQGTYYVGIATDKHQTTVNSNTITTIVNGTAEFLVYYQEVNNSEIYRPSSVGKENPITYETVFPGLLTATNPKDYYRFELKDKALVKFNFMYDSSKNAMFRLYGPDWEELVTKSFAGNNVWYNIEKYLEPGTYYCSLETITLNDGGRTSLLINQTVYPLILTQKNTTVNSYITVDTIDIPKEIRYVKGKLTNSELASSKWNSGKVITNEAQFGVNMTGYYTVRVTDEYGNMFMQSIKVDTCDKKAPAKPTIKNYKADTFEVTGTAEKNSTVVVTINKQIYTCTASSKGNYQCTLASKLIKGGKVEVYAKDISGNVSVKTVVTVK